MAADALHEVFQGQTHDKVDQTEANRSIQGLFSSLFFPQDDPEEKAKQGWHSPINCFFLATNLQEDGRFNDASAAAPKINHIDYILRLIASKELSNRTER